MTENLGSRRFGLDESKRKKVEFAPLLVRVKESVSDGRYVEGSFLSKDFRSLLDPIVVKVDKDGNWTGVHKAASKEAVESFANMLCEELSDAMKSWAMLWSGSTILPILVKEIERSDGRGDNYCV